MSNESDRKAARGAGARHERIKRVFVEASELDSADREAFLRSLRVEEAALAAEIESLLQHEHPRTLDLTARPAGENAEADSNLVDKRIGRYHTRRVIATGGMGVVYEAMQDSPRRVVALKLLRPGLVSTSVRRRFDYEAEALARLRHPGVAHILELGVACVDGLEQPFIAMEYIPAAKSITAYAADEHLTIRDRLQLFLQACDAVQHGHTRGVVHRDLKPANILVDSHGTCKIIDFGVARATDADQVLTTLQTCVGELIGTLQYMSPEQCNGDPHDLDTRSDVYSLGVVLYELLTGRLPYDLSTTPVLQAPATIREADVVRPSMLVRALRGDLEAIVLKALEKDRSQRYQSVQELGADIRRYLAGEPVLATTPTVVDRMFRYLRQRPWKAAAVGSSVLAVLVFSTSLAVVAAWRAEAEQRSRAELSAYGQKLVAAEAAILAGDGLSAESVLATTSRRGWEYDHLQARSSDALARLGADRLWRDSTLDSSDGLLLTVTREDTPGNLGVGVTLWGLPDDGLSTPPARVSQFGELVSAATFVSGESLVVLGHFDGSLSFWDVSEPARPEGFRRQPLADGRILVVSAVPELPLLIASAHGSHYQSPPTPSVLWVVRYHGGSIESAIPLPGHDSDVTAMAIGSSGRGTRLATLAFAGGPVRVWDISPDGQVELVALLDGHTDHLSDVALSPDGTTVATASIDQTVVLWDLEASEREYAELGQVAVGISHGRSLRHGAGVRSCDFSQEGTVLATVADDLSLNLWELGREPGQRGRGPLQLLWPDPVSTLMGHTDPASRARFVHERSSLLTISDAGMLREWPVRLRGQVSRLDDQSSSVVGVAFPPHGQPIVSLDGNGWLYLWDAETCEELAAGRIPGDETNEGQSLALHPSATVCAVGYEMGVVACLSSAPEDFATATWIDSGALGQGSCNAVAFSEDGGVLAAGGESGRIRLWQVGQSGVPQTDSERTWIYPGSVQAMAFSPNGPGLAVSGSAASGLETDSQAGPGAPVILLDTRTLEAKTIGRHPSACLAIAWSPDGKLIAVGGADGGLSVFRAGSSRPLYHVQAHAARVNGVAFHPTEDRLATSGGDRLVKLWDAKHGIEVLSLRGSLGHTAALAWSPDGNTLASTSLGSKGADNSVILWESNVPDEVQRLRDEVAWRAHLDRVTEGMPDR